MTDNDITALRLHLRKAGFHPLPLEGKAPRMPGWQQKFNPTKDEIRLWAKTWHLAQSTGVLAKFTPAVDIDITAEDAAEAVEALAREFLAEHGDVYVRIGKAPKRLIPLRTDEPFTKMSRVFIAPNGTGQKIEILGDGQQYVVDGIHPETGRPYSWHGGDLQTIKREDLPYVRRGDIELFLDAAARLLVKEFGYVEQGANGDARPLPHIGDAPPAAPTGDAPASSWDFKKDTRLRSALNAIPADEKVLTEKSGDSHITWVNIGRAIERLDWGERGYAIFRDWSTQNAQEFHERGLRTQWASFNRNRNTRERPITIATVFHYARQFGWGEQNSAKHQKDTKQEKPVLRWHGDVDPLESKPQLINKVLPEVGSGLISGQWGTYKTFLAFDLAASVMTGMNFIDFTVARRGGVLFIAAEGASEVPARLDAALRAKCPDMGRAPFVWLETCPALINLDTSATLAAIAKKAAAEMMARWGLPLALIIIDTIVVGAGFTKEGQDNDTAIAQRIMSTLAELAKATGTCTLGVDHFGKSIETGTRGSSAKEGSADVILALLGERNVAGTVTNTRLALRKRRGGTNGEEFPFTVREVDLGADRHGERVTTLTIDWTSKNAALKRGKAWSKALRLLQRTLTNALADHGAMHRPYADGPSVRAVNIEMVRIEFCKSYPADGDEVKKQDARRKAFSRAIKTAQADSLIGIRETGGTTFVWLSDA